MNFDPVQLVEKSISQGFDPSAFEELEEDQLEWATNIVEWMTDKRFLGEPSIFPSQLQTALRLFGDACPWCSDWEFHSKDFDVEEKFGNIIDRTQLLRDGICPKCKKTKLDQFKEGYWHFPYEFDLCWGMRCVPKSSWVYTSKGLVNLKDVSIGDTLTHGRAEKKFNSGSLSSLKITTEYNWTLTGAKETHIVPVLNKDFELEYKLMKECTVDDVLVLFSPNLWPQNRFKLNGYIKRNYASWAKKRNTEFITEVTPELARLTGYLVSDGNYTSDGGFNIRSSDPAIDEDINRCCLSVFGEELKLTRYQECKTTPFCKMWSLYSTEVMDWLRFIGLDSHTAYNKVIPDFILQSPKEIVYEFLAGLFGGDGGVHAETMPNGRKKILLYYTTVSKTLMEQVRLLLLNMGIVTRCSKLKINGFKKPNTYVKDFNSENIDNVEYTISTKSSEYVKIFEQNIRLVSEEKRKRLELAHSIKERTKYYTAAGTFTKKNAPEKLKQLISKGYFPVKIKNIQDGPDLEMMDVHIPETNIYTADGFIHHNSGKTANVGFIGSYLMHRTLRLPKPSDYFNLLKGDQLVMRFVAITEKQAKETNWMQFKRCINNGNWFNTYHDFLRYYEKKKGILILKDLTETLEYLHKNIKCYPLGATVDTLRGRTALANFIEEIGWWSGGEESKRANPLETYEAYQKASKTLRDASILKFMRGDYNTLTSYMGIVSSPMTKNDFIMRLVKEGKSDKKKVVSHKPSWEVNPNFFAAEQASSNNEQKSNESAYRRDYGAQPPFADSPYIDDEDLVKRMSVLEMPKWEIEKKESVVGMYLSAENLTMQKDVPYCLSIDIGESNCGYAATLLKLKEGNFAIAQVAGIFSIYPTNKKKIDIDAMFTSFIEPLCQKRLIKMVVYDRWQSKSQIQKLIKLDIEAMQYSLTHGDFISFRSQVIQGKLETVLPEMTFEEVESSLQPLESLLYPRSYLHFLWQLLSVEEIGKKITKGDGHDDIFRAAVLGTRFLWDDDYKQLFEYKGGMAQAKKRGLVASGTSRSGQSYSTTGNQYVNYARSSSGGTLGAVVTRNKYNR